MDNIRSMDNPRTVLFRMLVDASDLLKNDGHYKHRQILKDSYVYYGFSGFTNATLNANIVAAAYNKIGNAKVRLRKYEDAISDFDRAIESDKQFVDADNNREKVVIAYFQSAYNQYCIQRENNNNEISVNGDFGPQTRGALEMAKVAPPDSECHKAYSKHKDILDKFMRESSQ